jgi:hypothetical protein
MGKVFVQKYPEIPLFPAYNQYSRLNNCVSSVFLGNKCFTDSDTDALGKSYNGHVRGIGFGVASSKYLCDEG